MLGFWQTIKIALRLPYAKLSAAIMVLGPIAAFLIPSRIPDRKISTFVLMIIVFTTSIFIERFCAYVKAVRMEDIRRHSGKAGKKTSKGKKH